MVDLDFVLGVASDASGGIGTVFAGARVFAHGVFSGFTLCFENGKFISAEDADFAVFVFSDDIEDFASRHAYAGTERFKQEKD